MEIKLLNGKSTAEVVKLNGTVRRSQCESSKFVHQLLLHLEQKRFDRAPRFLGVDDKNREILSFLEGDVPNELRHFSDENLFEAACLIRSLHDATVDFPGLNADEIVCHNDLTPCNAVFVEGKPFAFIDFDAAGPGSRFRDLGYAVWQWLDLGNSNVSVSIQSKRIDLFLGGYFRAGEPVCKKSVLLAVVERQRELISFCSAKAQSNEKWKAAEIWGEKALHWVLNHMAELFSAEEL